MRSFSTILGFNDDAVKASRDPTTTTIPMAKRIVYLLLSVLLLSILSELSELLCIKEKHVKEALNSIKAKNITNIDTPSHEDSSRTLGEMIPSNQKNPEEVLQDNVIKQLILQSFSTLSKREELILRMRFGITDTLQNDENIYEIGEE